MELWPFWQYWFCLYRNKEHSSIFWCILYSLPPECFSYHLTGFFGSFVRIIPKYLIFLDTIVCGIVFLIYFSGDPLLLYCKAMDFCVLILYLVTLLNLIITSRSVLVEFFWVKDHAIYEYDSLISSSPIYILFIFFLAWFLWPKFQALYWTKVVMVDILVLFLTLEGKLSIFQHLIWCWQYVCHK